MKTDDSKAPTEYSGDLAALRDIGFFADNHGPLPDFGSWDGSQTMIQENIWEGIESMTRGELQNNKVHAGGVRHNQEYAGGFANHKVEDIRGTFYKYT
jgi:hypothetical protein